VTRANPLCTESMKQNSSMDAISEVSKEEGFFSLSTMSMDDKVHRFLAQAVELANQNSKTVTSERPHLDSGKGLS